MPKSDAQVILADLKRIQANASLSSLEVALPALRALMQGIKTARDKATAEEQLLMAECWRLCEVRAAALLQSAEEASQ